jgi:ABC-type polysaccharide/polyol phosphate transport system ATPase subunit
MDQYSDGMRARLSFACMIFTKPDILLLDEIIGTGDQFFIEKASKFLHNYINEIPIVLITSHDMEIIKNFCKKPVLLKEGKIHKYGKSDEIINYYQKLKELKNISI